jgi:hypothetical protein
MKRVFSSFNQVSVFHVQNLLNAEGILSEVKNLYLSSAMGELPPAECQVELWVEERDFERAQEALRAPRITGPDWTCSRCGEVSGAQFSQCWKCGVFRATAPP